MGLKYSINSAGRIVAERDIYSLGGFIPKGRLGGFIADETQLSQEGECWLDSGDISGRPDIVIKDNAYVGDFVGATGMHTDGVTEFSGNTLIPGKIIVRNPIADPINNFYAKDSFIGVSMDVLCGPSTTATAFPFEQGRYVESAPKGTLFTSASMKANADNFVRNTATLRLGRDTYICIPPGYNARIYWGYYDTSNQLAYAGESEVVSSNLYKVSHPIYKVCMVSIARNPTLTPAELGESGAKILGHISGSVLTDIRPESASGQYVMDKSSILMNTDNYGLAITQMRLLAGSMYDTTMYTKTDRSEYKLYGTFRNVERLEYTKYLRDSHRTAETRDTYISAYDCPLLRVDDNTYDDSLAAKGDLVLRRCIVPKAEFQDDVINGNTYEDIDFSYASEDLGYVMTGYARFISSHKQGIYSLSSGPGSTGFVSHKGNLAGTAKLLRAEEYIPLDGSIMEQGGYTATVGTYYENSKNTSAIRVRTGKPLPTAGAVFPTPPAGFKVTLIAYLGEDFKIQPSQVNPTTIETEYPYFVVVFGKADDSAITVNKFIALNRTLEIIDYTKVPEITGSAYVGAGCTVRGDVQLHGDPYVNRLLDVNLWERGTSGNASGTWDDMTKGDPLPLRYRLVDAIPVEPGGSIECGEAYYIECNIFDINGHFLHRTAWTNSYKIPKNGAFLGLVLRLVSDGLIEDSDIPLANVKYVRAFKKRRYIVNELDRTSPEGILLSVDYWEQGTAGGGQADAGKTYEELKATSGTTIRLKRPINGSPTSSISSASGFSRYIRVLDAVTKFRLGESLASAKMALLAAIIQKDPSAAIAPSEIPNSRLVLEFVPQPRIIVPYGSSTLFISGPKIRMYDNAVLSRNFSHDADIVLQGDAVMGYDFSSGDCLCSNGHDDAIIKLP
nr:MAG: L-fucokinase [Bacteriophage sp.]